MGVTADTTHLLPIAAGSQQAPKAWGPGVRSCYILHLVFSGRGTYAVDGELYPLTAGQSFLIRPNTSVEYYLSQEDPWSYIWIDFSGEEAEHLIRQTSLATHPVTPVLPVRELLPLYRHVADSLGLDNVHRCRASGYLYVLLSYYMEHCPAQKEAYAPPHLQRAVHFITANLHKPISVQDIANAVNISRTHLYRLFLTELSVSPSDYLTRCRIRRACHLLTDSALSMKEIAYSIGFDNPLYFSKVFHQHIGMSPSDYRSQQQTQPQR